MASLYIIEHKYAKAQPFLERLLATREEISGANDPKLEPHYRLLEKYMFLKGTTRLQSRCTHTCSP